MTKSRMDSITVESLPRLLEFDTKVKLAGIDVDGILRGKVISKKKFLSVAKKGFGFCSVIFGWDLHDQAYSSISEIRVKLDGSPDIFAYPDLNSFRRIPLENNIPLFMISFYDPVQKTRLNACPRGILKATVEKLKTNGFEALAGVEYEFTNFRVPDVDADYSTAKKANKTQTSVAKFFQGNAVDSLPYLTDGRYGYNLTPSVKNSDYFYEIFDSCKKFNCDIENWHSETGPGVFEAALAFDKVELLADKASLFKYAVKSIATQYGITPCFMAKPRYGYAGNSGHTHISLVDKNGKNIFARDQTDQNAKYEDIANLSDIGRYFLAGLLDGLPETMPIFAPTINSYKRFDVAYTAPATVSWGLEHRLSSIRIIAPPLAEPEATRFEIRVPGADSNPHYVLATIISLGLRGIEKKLEISQPPVLKRHDVDQTPQKQIRLARTLQEANERFMRQGGIAREVLGDEFVNHFGGTRNHEIYLWEQAVTDWEVKRYIEKI